MINHRNPVYEKLQTIPGQSPEQSIDFTFLPSGPSPNPILICTQHCSSDYTQFAIINIQFNIIE